MATILYLAHRLPYPPDKGDKVRTHHVLRHLHERHRVLLGTFVDDADDHRHVPTVRQWCDQAHVVPLRPAWARARSLLGLLRSEPLTLSYYRDRSMRHWVDGLRRAGGVDAVLVSSSSMAPYAQGLGAPVLMDFIDVDSAKWTAYAEAIRDAAGGAARRPVQWLYAREGRQLLRYERATAATAAASYFVTRREAELFRRLAPESAARVQVLGNGVDAAHFAPTDGGVSPFDAGEQAVVFTGTMSYRPNVDAVLWFAQHVLPSLRERHPAVRLSIVGRHPAPAVRALASPAVRVTGAVPDVRPWLRHAAVVVAPMQIARGVQNKILEAMAMARPVVTVPACAEALQARPGLDLLVADGPQAFIDATGGLLDDPARAQALGAAARQRVLDQHSWPASLAPLEVGLQACLRGPTPTPGGPATASLETL